MSPTYLAPDIYVEEIPSASRPIESVGTSTAAFVGVAPDERATLGIERAAAVSSYLDFAAKFAKAPDAPETNLSRAVFGFFRNGGTRCYIALVKPDQAISGDGHTRSGLDLFEEIDEIAIVAAPGYTDAASYNAITAHCTKMKDRVGILDAPNTKDIDLLTEDLAPRGDSSTVIVRPPASDGGYTACYYPWLRVPVKGGTVDVPPSGHVAGIWARTDGTRGVHKAPANETVFDALDLTYNLTREELGKLNQAGINCIRRFPDGIRVWGARTLAGSASEWRYLNVRRLFNMIEESIAENTRWIVFEPNDQTLWKAIRRDISAYLRRLWREGALMGRTPEEAFFVRCDETTNPPEVIDAGQVVTLVGIAPVKPAEFVIFRISQYASGVETETVGGSNGRG